VWDILAPVPAPRTENTAVAVGGKVYVFGGLGPNGVPDATRLDIYDPATNAWARGPDLPLPLHHTQAVVLGGTRILVLGGYIGAAFTPVPTTFLLETALPAQAQVWLPFVPLPEPRGAHAVASDGARVWVWGGIGPAGHLATAWRMDAIAGITIPVWLPMANFPSPRDHLTGGYLDGKVLGPGGRVGPNTGRLDIYDPATDTWSVGPSMPTPRGGIAGAPAAGRFWVFGGEAGGGVTFDEAEGYSVALNNWVSAPPMPHSRHGLGAAGIGDAIYVEAGGPVAGLTYSGHNERLRILAP
jgi:hypothetical protein